MRRTLFSLAALTFSLACCAYDWQIGGPAADAGTGGSAMMDAATVGSSTTASTSTGAGGDAAAPDCSTLAANLDAARNQAKSCTIGASGQCDASVQDECGCTSYVAHGGSAAANAFAAAVQAFEMAGCQATCSSCLPSSAACLYSSGKGPYCLP